MVMKTLQTIEMTTEKNGNINSFIQGQLKSLFSVLLTESLTRAGVARWYTGCYINKEDACFQKKLDNSLSKQDYVDTVKDNTLRGYPVPFTGGFKGKEILRTNGASKLLGLSVLLDPTLHDKIDGEWNIW